MALIQKAALQGLHFGDVVSDVANIWAFNTDYQIARDQGDSKAVAVAKGAGSFVWTEAVFGGANHFINNTLKLTGGKAIGANLLFMGIYAGVTAGSQMVGTMWEHNARTLSKGYEMRGKLGSGSFNMSNAGYTMRQRSLNAIRSNGLNTQSALGNEAKTYFRGSGI